MKGSDNDHIASSYRSGVVGGSDVAHISHNMTRDSLATWVDCGAGTEAGFCSMTTDYPLDTVQSLVSGQKCKRDFRKFHKNKVGKGPCINCQPNCNGKLLYFKASGIINGFNSLQ